MSKTDHERLVAIQSEIKSVPKNGYNPFTKSKYANLNDCLGVAKEVINKHGLFLEQSINDGIVTSAIRGLENKILIQSSLRLPDIVDPQKIGSAITYYRRYTLKALLAIDDEDDDGNNASLSQSNKSDLYRFKVLKDLKGKDIGQLSDEEIGKLKSQLAFWSAKKADGEVIKGALKEDLNAAHKFLQS